MPASVMITEQAGPGFSPYMRISTRIQHGNQQRAVARHVHMIKEKSRETTSVFKYFIANPPYPTPDFRGRPQCANGAQVCL